MFENLSVFENRYEELNMKLYDPAVCHFKLHILLFIFPA